MIIIITKKLIEDTDGSIVLTTTYEDGSKEMYEKDIEGYEQWWKYDENNNTIHFKDSEGFKEERSYDERNNQTYFENSSGSKWEKSMMKITI